MTLTIEYFGDYASADLDTYTYVVTHATDRSQIVAVALHLYNITQGFPGLTGYVGFSTTRGSGSAPVLVNHGPAYKLPAGYGAGSDDSWWVNDYASSSPGTGTSTFHYSVVQEDFGWGGDNAGSKNIRGAFGNTQWALCDTNAAGLPKPYTSGCVLNHGALPNYWVNHATVPAVAIHDYNAIEAGYARTLRRDVSIPNRNARRNRACPTGWWAPGKNAINNTCDEYPYANTYVITRAAIESSSTAPVPGSQNSSEGGQRVQFYFHNRIHDGEAFNVQVNLGPGIHPNW